MRGEINIQSLDKKYHPEAARNREIVAALINHPDTKIVPIVRRKRRPQDAVELANAKSKFKKAYGDAWDSKYAKKKAQRKAAQKAKA